MQLAYDNHILLPLVALFAAVVLVARVWRYRTRPIATTFLVLMIAIAWWSMAVVLEHTSVGLSAKFFWVKMSYLGITALPVAWLVFTLQYTNREKWLTRRNFLMLSILPAITLIMVWTNDLHHLMWQDIWLDTSMSPPEDVATHNTWFWVYASYAYLILLLSTVCLFSFFLRASSLYRTQVGAMLLATLVPWIANFLYIAGIGPFMLVDPTPLAFVITGVAFYWGLSRLQLLDIMPIAHEAIYKSMGDGVIVIDIKRRVIEVNPAAERITERKRSDMIGKPYSLVLPGQAGLLDLPSEPRETQGVIALGEGQAQRYYRIYISPIVTRQRFSGHLMLLHDDTERYRAEVQARERAILETELYERKRAQEELAKSEENYSTIVEKGNDGIIILQDGVVKFANSKMIEITGFSLDETLGQPFIKFVSPEHRGLTIDRYKKRMSGEEVPGKYEIEILTKDGKKIPVEINANKIEYEAKAADMAIIRDMTEHKRAEETLKASETKFRNLVENAAAGILTTLPDGRILSANKAALEIYGYDSEEELTKASVLARYVNPDDREHLLKLIEKKGVAKGFEIRMKHKDGTPFWASLNVITQITESGEKQFLSIIEDITERKQAAVELSRLNEELRLLNLQLEAKVEERTRQLEEAVTVARAANQAKSQFLASMSHELRTPLNAILGFSQMLQEQFFGSLNEKQAEYVSDILDSGKHLLSLINDILDLSKIEAGKIELEISTVNMRELLQNSLVMVKEKALAHGISLNIQMPESIDTLEIRGDARRLKQVMFNLLSNATKFTPDGGSITIEAKKEGSELLISVSDTGIGITPEEQKKIFREFYQIRSGIQDKNPGTGLGLVITKNIVEKHSGRIWVESEGLNKGSRFSFTLPI